VISKKKRATQRKESSSRRGRLGEKSCEREEKKKERSRKALLKATSDRLGRGIQTRECGRERGGVEEDGKKNCLKRKIEKESFALQFARETELIKQRKIRAAGKKGRKGGPI